jgi:hypothetical protein
MRMPFLPSLLPSIYDRTGWISFLFPPYPLKFLAFHLHACVYSCPLFSSTHLSFIRRSFEMIGLDRPLLQMQYPLSPLPPASMQRRRKYINPLFALLFCPLSTTSHLHILPLQPPSPSLSEQLINPFRRQVNYTFAAQTKLSPSHRPLSLNDSHYKNAYQIRPRDSYIGRRQLGLCRPSTRPSG